MTGNRLLAWVGPDPERIDVAHVVLAPDRLSAHGSSTAPEYALTYRLVTGPGWVTQRLDVRVDGDGWSRTLGLRRGAEGTWTSRRVESGTDGEATVSALEHPELAGALDCDLGLCPVTNTMPVLRAGLIEAARRGEQQRAELTVAWVAVPELDVLTATQQYESGAAVAGGGAQIRFQAGSFVEHIEVDADGLVVSYPSISRRIAG
jgi:uncharacterized protein